jgi:hypothetical protein
MRKHLQFLTGRWVLVLHLLLIVQAFTFYQFSQKEETLELGALSDLPENLGPWYGRQEDRPAAQASDRRALKRLQRPRIEPARE